MESKAVAHIKDNKLSGKDGGSGWNDFYEDLMVVFGATDKDLESAVGLNPPHSDSGTTLRG